MFEKATKLGNIALRRRVGGDESDQAVYRGAPYGAMQQHHGFWTTQTPRIHLNHISLSIRRQKEDPSTAQVF